MLINFVVLELDTPGNCRVASATRRTYRGVISSTGPSEKSARDESACCKTKPRQRVQRQCRKSRCVYTFSLYRYSFNMLVKYVVYGPQQMFSAVDVARCDTPTFTVFITL